MHDPESLLGAIQRLHAVLRAADEVAYYLHDQRDQVIGLALSAGRNAEEISAIVGMSADHVRLMAERAEQRIVGRSTRQNEDDPF
jgi:hypothetical protein